MMTVSQFHELHGQANYTFKLYNGITKVGYITNDFHNNDQYYIVFRNNSNRNKPDKEIGYPVKLGQIETWELWEPSPYINTESVTLPAEKSKKAIILGAGASFDFDYSSQKGTNKMPLTKNLFDSEYLEILKKYQGAYELSSEILLGKQSLEDYFQKQWQKIEKTHDQFLLNKVISAQYYLHDLFLHLSKVFSGTQTNNYSNLVKLAHEYSNHHNGEIIPVVTFNYDTLFEEGLNRQLQYSFHTFRDYVDFEKRKILLFKPHGSCNWVRKFNLSFAPATFIHNDVNSIDLLAKHIYVNNYSLHKINTSLNPETTIYYQKPEAEDRKENLRYNFHYPWMLIPYKEKDDLIMPSAHQTILRHYLSHVEEFLIIGWRGAESVFQKLLQSSVGGRKIKITLVEPNVAAIDEFITLYKGLLPNVEFITAKEDDSYSTFSKFIAGCHEKDNHFFTGLSNKKAAG